VGILPARISSSVVFPAPLGPAIAVTSPGLASQFTSFKMNFELLRGFEPKQRVLSSSSWLHNLYDKFLVSNLYEVFLLHEMGLKDDPIVVFVCMQSERGKACIA
jgi:hypothetical protein